MDDLHALYQEMILDHSKSPHNFGVLTGANRESEGYNPLCGDKITVQLIVEGDIVKDVHFVGEGCAISMASASLMTDMVKGMTKEEVEILFQAFHALVTGQTPEENISKTLLNKLVALSGVQHFPMRVKCATLAWHTLDAAIKKTDQPVTTE